MRSSRFVGAVAAAGLLTACTAEEEPGRAPSASVEAPPVVAFLGDSITSGYGDVDYERIWPERVSERYGWDLRQFSVAGTGYLAPSEDLAFGSRVPEVVEAAPDAVVIAGGTNDLLYGHAEVRAAAAAVLDELRAGLPEARLVLASAFYAPALLDGATPSGVAVANIVRQQTDDLRTLAEERGIPFLDTTGVFADTDPKGLILDDGVHPNDAGHELIAERLGPLLAELVEE